MITAHLIYTLKKVTFTLLAVMLAAFVFVILLTYTPNDPSWSRISSDMGQISNMGGAVGAWVSDLLYTFMGWSAWWLMVFLAYEAVCIWWHREQAFGPLRAIGYVFLLLASCGLVAITPQLLGLISDNGARFGGILGAEVATRLSGLLTIYGASAFLLVFTLITATFAFNIHWKRVFDAFLSLSWLGNGLKRQPTVDGVSQKGESEMATHVSQEQPEDLAADGSPLMQQLKLNLPESEDDEAVDLASEPSTAHASNPSLSNVLDDFLVNSGLTESILALQEQEAQEAHQAKSAAQAPVTAANGSIAPESSLIKKQEPSFAWNDQDVINELLDEQALPTAVANSVDASSPSMADSSTQTQQAADYSVSPSPSEAKAPIDNADNTAPADTHNSDIEQQAFDVYDVKVPDTAQAQQETETVTDVTDVTDESELSINEAATTQSELETDDQTALYDAKDEGGYLDNNNADEDTKLETPLEDVEQNVEHNVEPPAFVDLTPTNTPPSNPKKPHEPQPASEPTQAAPTIRFATPEGDASNHIEDMMPDVDEDEFVLPEIHDDTAYASTSRAMQTAKYREGLSPIPELSILDKPDPDRKPSYTQQELAQLSELLEIKLQEFNVKAEVVNAIPGPVVTRFEVDLAPGVKASKVTGISRDLARSLSMASLRVVEVIPGKPFIGIEVPNKKREMVRLIELLQTEDYKNPKAQISMAMGKDIGGKPIITDLARAPHMLVAGTTGSGKSVLVNAMLLSMLLKYKPSELRLILIDPKQLELANYNDIPHLLTPVVTDMNEAASSLSWCVAEMERRYQLMSLLKVRKLGEFNKKVIAAEKAGRPIIDPLWRPNDSVSIDKAPKLKTLPMIVIVADEFADMIMQVGKQAEELITRLAQKSRAAGIHLMLATQRPSVDVITGLIKANIPVRAALRVNSKVDSRTILDAGGAEDMLGNGDMLFLGPGQIEPDRVHGAYVSDEEVNRVCDAWRERGAPDYIDNMASNFELTSPSSSGAGNTSGEDDALYDEAVAFVMETRKVSASSIQRKFSIGYNRAARIVDSMEEAGLVSSMGKSGKRELLM